MAVPVEAGSSFAAGTPVPLIPRAGYEFPAGARRYDVAPDGRFLLLKAVTEEEQPAAGAPPPHLVFVEHWFEELKRLVPR